MDLLDIITDENNFKDIGKELLEEGKCVIGRNPIISEEYNYMIEPDRKAYLVKPDESGTALIKVRQLSNFECMCIGLNQYE